MPPTSKKLSWPLNLVLGCLSVCSSHACHILWTVHTRVLKFHIWIPHEKIAEHVFFFLVWVISLSGVMPFWKNQNEIWCMPYLMNHACQGRVLKFHIWIPHRKTADPFFFLSRLSPFLKLWPFEKISMKSCQQDIQKLFELGVWNFVSW